MIDVTASEEIADDARARANVLRLAAAQALTGTNSAVIFATGSIVGATLAPNISFATMPLIVLGVGWNFGFVGASALVLETHRPQERNKVQAFNDFLVFGMMAIGSFSSGQLLANYGWSAVNMVVFPPVLLGLAVLSFVSFAKRRAKLRAVDEFPEPGV
jgi:MFS family permease